MRVICTKKNWSVSQLGAENITFSPKPDIHTDGRSDISVYRVASLLKMILIMHVYDNCVMFSHGVSIITIANERSNEKKT